MGIPPVATNRRMTITIFAAFLSIMFLESTKITDLNADCFIYHVLFTEDCCQNHKKTGKSIWFSGFRQVLFGLAAAVITFGIGRLIGVSISG
jgi:hypothetical protein